MAHHGPHRVQVTTTTTQRPAQTGYITLPQGVILGQPPVPAPFPVSPAPTGVVLSGTPLPGVSTVSPQGPGVFLRHNPHQHLGVQGGQGVKKTTIITKKTVKAASPTLPGYGNHLAKPSAVVVTTNKPGQSTSVQVTHQGGQVTSVSITKRHK